MKCGHGYYGSLTGSRSDLERWDVRVRICWEICKFTLEWIDLEWLNVTWYHR